MYVSGGTTTSPPQWLLVNVSLKASTKHQQTRRSCDGHLPRPAMQCTATQLVGSAVNRDRSTSNQSTTTLSGGGIPSSNGKSCTTINIISRSALPRHLGGQQTRSHVLTLTLTTTTDISRSALPRHPATDTLTHCTREPTVSKHTNKHTHTHTHRQTDRCTHSVWQVNVIGWMSPDNHSSLLTRTRPSINQSINQYPTPFLAWGKCIKLTSCEYSNNFQRRKSSYILCDGLTSACLHVHIDNICTFCLHVVFIAFNQRCFTVKLVVCQALGGWSVSLTGQNQTNQQRN